MPDKSRDRSVRLCQLYSDLQPVDAEPFSIEVLGAAVAAHCLGTDVRLTTLDRRVEPLCVDRLFEELAAASCEILGLSVPQGTFELADTLLARLAGASRRPAIVLLGHAIPTNAPEFFLQRYPWAIAANGWGEDALITLVQMREEGRVDPSRVPGITYAENGRLRSTSISNAFTAKPPIRLNTGRYFSRIETSRGCHYGRCTFCTRPPGPKDSWNRLPLSDIGESVQRLKDAGVKEFTFTDEDFVGSDLEGARQIARAIASVGEMQFSLSVRADNVWNPVGTADENRARRDVLVALRDAGLKLVFLGLESVAETQLRRFGKGNGVRASLRGVDVVRDLSIPIELGFMPFDPFVTLDELRETVDTLERDGLWEHVSNLFSAMRVQKNTAFEAWLSSKRLLGAFDPNTISYDWEYLDQQAGAIAKACLHWEASFLSLHRALRNFERTLSGHTMAQDFFHRSRALDMKVFHSLVAAPPVAATAEEALLAFQGSRQSLVDDLHRSLPTDPARAPDRHLAVEVSAFRNGYAHRNPAL